ncbi:hypothetical protein GOBAR_AA20331 [Gossypium barbadense]|uniref:Uncharacterized protein n=1 Tax=Gossypium barbadense TaxID=3634 RepID=A0A2P5XAI5_GOSBA|nr:hypothetical protein GOBAR_AA20331 [Gossypium barbadense]
MLRCPDHCFLPRDPEPLPSLSLPLHASRSTTTPPLPSAPPYSFAAVPGNAPLTPSDVPSDTPPRLSTSCRQLKRGRRPKTSTHPQAPAASSETLHLTRTGQTSAPESGPATHPPYAHHRHLASNRNTLTSMPHLFDNYALQTSPITTTILHSSLYTTIRAGRHISATSLPRLAHLSNHTPHHLQGSFVTTPIYDGTRDRSHILYTSY